jgi:hypothetical protein
LLFERPSRLIFFDYSGPIRPGASGAVDTVGTGDGPVRRWRWTLSNESSPVRSGTSGTVNAVGAGDGTSGLRRRKYNGEQTKRCNGQWQNVFHFKEAFFRLAGRFAQVAQ